MNDDEIYEYIHEKVLYSISKLFTSKEEQPTDEEIKKSIDILVKDTFTRSMLERSERNYRKQKSRSESNKCKVCGKEYAIFGFQCPEDENKTDWYCYDHELLGKLKSFKNKLELESEKTVDKLFELFSSFIDILIYQFNVNESNKMERKDLVNDIVKLLV